MRVIGITVDPVVAAAVAQGLTRVVEWPPAWTSALHRQGMGLARENSPPILGAPVFIHGALGWSADAARRARAMGVDERARGRVVARAVIDRIVDGAAHLAEVEAIAPVVAAGNALAPWSPSWALRAGPGAPVEGSARRVGAAPGPERIYCNRCWRLVGVELGPRSVSVRGTRVALPERTGRGATPEVTCGECLDGPSEAMWGDVVAWGPGPTELLSRARLDEAVGGPIAQMLAGWTTPPVEVPVIDAHGGWVPADHLPSDDWLGQMLPMRRRGNIHAVARLSGWVDGERVVGQQPDWLGRRPTSAPRAWLLDEVVSIPPIAWSGPRVAGDMLRLIVERLRAAGASISPWLRWPGVRLHQLLVGITRSERVAAAAAVAARLAQTDATWSRWICVDGQLVGDGVRVQAPTPAEAWASLVRDVAGREDMHPAPHPTGLAPAGRYWIIGPDGPAVIDHDGTRREGLVWLARIREPRVAGEAREEGA